MRQLSKTQTTIFLLGGVLMVASVACYILMWQQKVTCWTFLAGAVMFATMQISQSYDGRSLTISRLKKIMGFADICFIMAGILIVDSTYNYLATLFTNWETYIEYVYNKWVLLLLVAAILEIYSTHRMASELKKEQDGTAAK